jgi:ankyrin repeat protein
MERVGLAALILLTSSVHAADTSSKDMYQAIRQNDLPRLRLMLASGAAANLRDSRGVTPLMYASAVGTAGATQILIEAGADVNAKSVLDATALLWGATDPAKARLLLAAGADVNAKSKIGRTPLIVAAGRSGSAETVRLLLAKGADAKTADATGSTSLIEAARANDLATIRLLLPARPDLNAGDVLGFTALMLAAGHSNLAAVNLLLDSGADVNASHITELPVKHGLVAISKYTALMAAAPRRSPEVVGALLQAGADVNATDIRGMTPLMVAVASDVSDPRVVGLLLDNKASRAIKSKDGETALDWALKFGNPEILRLLGSSPLKSKLAVKPTVYSNGDAAAAVGRAIPLLQISANEFFKQTGCVGCHHQNLSGLAVATASRKGVSVDEKTIAEQRLIAKSELLRERENVLQGFFISPDGLIYSMMQLAEQNYPADEITDALGSCYCLASVS